MTQKTNPELRVSQPRTDRCFDTSHSMPVVSLPVEVDIRLSDVDHLKEVGFIAQDVLEIPELAHLVAVPEDVETTVYGLDYQGINNYLVQAVQELSVTLDSEKMKNEALEARISALENN